MKNGECPVPADIQEGLQDPGPVLDNEERITRHMVTGILPVFLEARLVRNHDPFFGVYGPPFELVEGGLSKPRRRENGFESVIRWLNHLARSTE